MILNCLNILQFFLMEPVETCWGTSHRPSRAPCDPRLTWAILLELGPLPSPQPSRCPGSNALPWTVLNVPTASPTCACVLSRFSRVQLCTTLRTVACQAPLSMGLSRQEYWSGLPWPPPGDPPDPGIEPGSLTSPALACGCFTTSITWEAQPVP